MMKYSFYEVLVNYHGATVLNNRYHIKTLVYKNNKLNEKLDNNNKLIREFILENIEKHDLSIK